MRDPVNRLLILIGAAVILGIVIGVKASDAIDKHPDTAAEIAEALRLT